MIDPKKFPVLTGQTPASPSKEGFAPVQHLGTCTAQGDNFVPVGAAALMEIVKGIPTEILLSEIERRIEGKG